ncbi:FHA domain-containing protein [Solirubrobacter soli]|uniref:FHA domain-containing protein n=1 Tax=Solirubrobacter soli TaxID=363832 RepID=UPI000402A7BC|nr:FHA domain-containing protein [Solirubrobacter soli]
MDPFDPHTSTPEELVRRNELDRSGTPYLAWRGPEGDLRIFELDPEDADDVTIGANAACTIVLEWDDKVSRLHAEVGRRGGDWLIVDDGLSRNGTYVGGERMSGRRRLRDEDRIVVGATIVAFRAGEAHERETQVTDGHVGRGDLTAIELLVLQRLCAPLVLEGADEPMTNEDIAKDIHYSLDGVKRGMTRLLRKFDITERPQRRRLAKRAIATGIVSRSDYPTTNA